MSRTSERSEETGQIFIFVHKGMVQRMPARQYGGEVKVWPVAKNLKDAKRLAAWLSAKNPGKNISASLVGSVQDETLNGHIELALAEGCVATCCVRGWEKNGSPRWGWLHFDKH